MTGHQPNNMTFQRRSRAYAAVWRCTAGVERVVSAYHARTVAIARLLFGLRSLCLLQRCVFGCCGTQSGSLGGTMCRIVFGIVNVRCVCKHVHGEKHGHICDPFGLTPC